MFFFLNLDLSYRLYSNVCFDIICDDVVYPPGKSYLYLHVFVPIKDFFHVYNVNTLAKRKILKNFRNTESFI